MTANATTAVPTRERPFSRRSRRGANYLAAAVRDGATTPDAAIRELVAWSEDDPDISPTVYAPAAYLDAEDPVALHLLTEAALHAVAHLR